MRRLLMIKLFVLSCLILGVGTISAQTKCNPGPPPRCPLGEKPVFKPCDSTGNAAVWVCPRSPKNPRSSSDVMTNISLPKNDELPKATTSTNEAKMELNPALMMLDLIQSGQEKKDARRLIIAAQILLTLGPAGNGSSINEKDMMNVTPEDVLNTAYKFASESKDKIALMQIAKLFGDTTIGLHNETRAKQIRQEASQITGDLPFETPTFSGESKKTTRDVWRWQNGQWYQSPTNSWVFFSNTNNPNCQVVATVPCTADMRAGQSLWAYFYVSKPFDAAKYSFTSMPDRGVGSVNQRIWFSPNLTDWQLLTNWSAAQRYVTSSVDAREGYFVVETYLQKSAFNLGVTINW